MNYFLENMLPEERALMPTLTTTAELMDFTLARYAAQTALSDLTFSETYAEMNGRVARRRHVLTRLGLTRGANIGLMDINSINGVEWFLAITSYGCSVVMLPPSLDAAVLANATLHYELEALIIGDGLRAKADGLPLLILSAGEMDAEGVPAADIAPAQRAAIFFTGGTTGTPKGVVLSHRALLRGSLNGTYRRGTVFGQTMVAALPFTHVFGMIFSLMSGLYAGSHISVCGQMRDMFRYMAQARPTTMIAVPGMAEIMLRVAQTRGVEALGGRLKLIICGAAPVPPRLHEAFVPLGIEVLAGYGMTETANLVSGNLDVASHPESVGQFYPEQEWRIVDDELQVRGTMLFDGYWKDEEATRAAMTEDGYLRTGDLARVDAEGYLTIIGRRKNLIILDNGENVSPEEVEAVFYRSALVRDCLVSKTVIQGTPAILLEVQPMPSTDADEVLTELRRIAQTLPTTMRPARIELREADFEKSPSMKIIRKGVRT